MGLASTDLVPHTYTPTNTPQHTGTERLPHIATHINSTCYDHLLAAAICITLNEHITDIKNLPCNLAQQVYGAFAF